MICIIIQFLVQKVATFLLYPQLVGTYYGMARASVCLSGCLSVCGSVHKACKHDTEFQLGPTNLVHV